MTSEKVALIPFLYQEVEKQGIGFFFISSLANRQTKENNPIKHGEVLLIAFSDHWLLVSKPKLSLTSWKVTSMLKRKVYILISNHFAKLIILIILFISYSL